MKNLSFWFLYSSRMSSCFFSSRLRTRISPTSVSRNRRSTAFPKVPVPPVIRIVLSRNCSSFAVLAPLRHQTHLPADPPSAAIRRRASGPAPSPSPSPPAGSLRTQRSAPEPLGPLMERSRTPCLVRLDLDAQAPNASFASCTKQVVLRNRIRRDVIETREAPKRSEMSIRRDPRHLVRRDARVDHPPEASNPLLPRCARNQSTRDLCSVSSRPMMDVRSVSRVLGLVTSPSTFDLPLEVLRIGRGPPPCTYLPQQPLKTQSVLKWISRPPLGCKRRRPARCGSSEFCSVSWHCRSSPRLAA